MPVDAWGKPFIYLKPGLHGEYDLYSLGADGVEGGEEANADITNWVTN
jgi:general secretion pathway protein G